MNESRITLPVAVRIEAGRLLASPGGNSPQRAMKRAAETVARLMEQARRYGLDPAQVQEEARAQVHADTDRRDIRRAQRAKKGPQVYQVATDRAALHAKALHGLVAPEEAPQALTEGLADVMAYSATLARSLRGYVPEPSQAGDAQQRERQPARE